MKEILAVDELEVNTKIRAGPGSHIEGDSSQKLAWNCRYSWFPPHSPSIIYLFNKYLLSTLQSTRPCPKCFFLKKVGRWPKEGTSEVLKPVEGDWSPCLLENPLQLWWEEGKAALPREKC